MALPNARTILLVDDDAAVLAVLQEALTLNGYQVIVENDGASALARHEQDPDAIDLLISDLQMPHLDGQELARRVRETRPDLPIIFMSGSSGDEFLSSLAAFPKHRFLRKPFFPSQLLAEVRQIFGDD